MYVPAPAYKALVMHGITSRPSHGDCVLTRVVLTLQESATTYATEEKERDRIQGKYEAYVTKLTNVGKSMAEVKDSAEYKKLVKRLQVRR